MVIGHATYLDIKTPFGSIYYATLMQENGVDTSLLRGGCGQNPGHLNEVLYGIYSPTNYCSIKTV